MDKKQTCKAILSLYASLDDANWQLANNLLSAQDLSDEQFLKILGYNKLGIRHFYDFARGIKNKLWVKNCDNSKLEVIADLGVHHSFYFEDGHFSKYNKLGSLGNTKQLSFARCSFSNLDFLQNMPNLHSLSFDNCQIKDFNRLADVQQLQNLSLFNQKNFNFAVLCSSQRLEFLYFNQIEQLTMQNIHLPALYQLLLINCGLRHLKNLPICPKLERLNLDDNQLQHLRGVEQLPNVTYLSANNNGLRHLDGLHGLAKLQYADFQHNKIRVFSPQADIFAQDINLDFNPLQKIANLHRLVNARSLSVRDCQIKDFGELAHAPQLKRLSTQNLSAQATESLRQFDGRF